MTKKIQSIYLTLLPIFNIIHRRILDILTESKAPFNIISSYYIQKDESLVVISEE